MWRTLTTAWFCVHALGLGAQQSARTFLVVISGVGGEPRVSDAFYKMGSALVDAARGRFALPDSNVWYVAEDSARDPKRIYGRSSKATVESILAKIAAQATPNDRLVILLMGHGVGVASDARIGLPGPDMSAADFAAALGSVKATVAFLHTGSASGAFVQALSGSNRIVVAATKSGREQNETIFPNYFVPALTTLVSDTDKDGRVSLLEAFAYAKREVDRQFEQKGLLPTEHAVLDDNGDGEARNEGTASGGGGDGARARTFFLEPLGGATLASDPRAAVLLAARRELESQIDALRGKRASMTEEAYQRALEPLLLALAEKTRALRALEGKKP